MKTHINWHLKRGKILKFFTNDLIVVLGSFDVMKLCTHKLLYMSWGRVWGWEYFENEFLFTHFWLRDFILSTIVNISTGFVTTALRQARFSSSTKFLTLLMFEKSMSDFLSLQFAVIRKRKENSERLLWKYERVLARQSLFRSCDFIF